MVIIVLELLSDKNSNIKSLVNAILDYVQLHDEMWKQEIKIRRFNLHNSVYMEILDEFDKQYPVEQMDPEEAMYEEMYYYDQMQNAAQEELYAQMAGMDPKQRAEYIRALKAEAMANG